MEEGKADLFLSRPCGEEGDSYGCEYAKLLENASLYLSFAGQYHHAGQSQNAYYYPGEYIAGIGICGAVATVVLILVVIRLAVSLVLMARLIAIAVLVIVVRSIN